MPFKTSLSRHQVKAYGIDEGLVKTPAGYTGLVAELSGEVPTQFHVFCDRLDPALFAGSFVFQDSRKKMIPWLLSSNTSRKRYDAFDQLLLNLN